VARLGGDQFAVLKAEPRDGSPDTAAATLGGLIAQPFFIDGNEVRITASFGIALYSAEAASPAALTAQAGRALARAKREGRDCRRFYNEALDVEMHERFTLAAELRAAIERDEFRLHYQPQIDLASGRLVGVEALLRWQHPQRGLIDADRFISAAERTGGMAPLGHWVLDEACRQINAWHRAGLFPGVVALNVSAVQLADEPDLDTRIAAALARWQLEPRDIEIELAESVFMGMPQPRNRLLEPLRRIGVRTAIEDFATGCFSLRCLTGSPVTRLKIAHAMVFGVATDPSSATVVRAAVRIARTLGIGCIAAGVETSAQAEFLRSAGCEAAQGHHFGAPVSAEQMTERLREENAARRLAPTQVATVAG
jgi:EAL domain-containing protein (putative c-di-GMP-specific phosphodiesterase class I)